MKIYQNNEITAFLSRFESRRNLDSTQVEKTVNEILLQVRQRGDAALYEYAARFDRVDLHRIGLQVPPEELIAAHQTLAPDLLKILREARDNIQRFHTKGLPQSWLTWEDDQVVLGQRVLPLERIGVYVPGGSAAYPSSLLMGVVPAQVAGVKEIYIATPCDTQGTVNKTILAAAWELGIEQIFRVGGAHAIAAFAFGTETISRVDKIVGPGNIYVATAKKLLYGQCGIDMVAGPSEVVIIADARANCAFVTADLLAQSEHDALASSILLTDSLEFAQQVLEEIQKEMATLPRKEIISRSLNDFGGIIVSESITQCIDLCNRLAPEHLGLHVEHPWEILSEIKNAGAIFLGSFSPEAVGDYWAGPNHVLPTNGSARFFSPLRTEDFLKVSSIIAYSKPAMKKNGTKMIRFAESEGLLAHGRAIEKRIIAS